MQSQFLTINVIAICGCSITMYLTVIYWRMRIKGFIIGFMSRFIIEIIYEVVYLYFHFPDSAKIMPSLRDIQDGLSNIYKFSLTFVIGYSMKVFLFETTSLIFFQAPNPEQNIALWMCLCQLNVTGT